MLGRRIVLCYVVYHSCGQSYTRTHTYEQFLQVTVGLGLNFMCFLYLCKHASDVLLLLLYFAADLRLTSSQPDTSCLFTPQLLLVLIGPTHGGMDRLSRRVLLVVHPDRLPALGW